jgi:ABC-type branched-subunit amino acid transport system substrate-binding protein
VSAQQRLVIGLVTPLSGPLAAVGREVSSGTRAFFETLKGPTAFAGRQIELVIVDDGNDPKRSTQGVKELIATRNPIAFVNCFGTVGCAAQAKALRGTGIPMIGPIAGAQSLRTPEQRHVFAIRPNAATEVRVLADHLKDYGTRELFVIYQDDGFGRAYLPIAEALLREVDLKVAKVIQINPNSPDYDGAAAQVGRGVQAVLLLANVSHSVGVLKALSARGVETIAMNLAEQANAAFISNMSGLWSYSVFATFTPNPWKRQNAAAREYQDAWRQVAEKQPFSYLGFESYLNARILGEAIARIGAAERRATPERLVAALEVMPPLNFDGLAVKFGPDVRQGSSFVDLSVLSSRGGFVQ